MFVKDPFAQFLSHCEQKLFKLKFVGILDTGEEVGNETPYILTMERAMDAMEELSKKLKSRPGLRFLITIEEENGGAGMALDHNYLMNRS